MKLLIPTMALSAVMIVSAAAQPTPEKPETSPTGPVTSPPVNAQTCKPQPDCVVMFFELLPAAPGGGLKAQGRVRTEFDNLLRADRGQLTDPKSFRLPDALRSLQYQS
jgi:hypothetical protein